jgi:aryl-alcohol dehydrogenase-like predicted oxidoreductase
VHTSLSLGTYRIPLDSDLSLFNTILDSVYSGSINTIDTGIHWRYGRSEKTIGAALRKIVCEGFVRDELFISTRIGHVDEDIDKGIDNS